LRGIGKLTKEPYVIKSELNEWLRFDKPGHYRLYVVSPRVGRKKTPTDHFSNQSFPVVSNIIDIEILPVNQNWAKQKLNEAITALSKPDTDHRAVCRTLRFLGTIAAVTEMRKRLGSDDLSCQFECQFGLISSPHRDFVIRDMESALTSPDQPVTSNYLRTLALLEFVRQTPPPPPAPPQGNEEQIKDYQTLMQRRQSSYNELLMNYLRQLVTAIPQKQKRARAKSLETLLDYRSEIKTDDFAQWSTLLASMPDLFSLLPLDAQTRLLSYQWKPIASASMVPVLRGILKAPDNQRESYQQRELRSIALRRLFESAPDEGRRLILDEIRRPKPRVNQTVLRSLPDETLPELDNVLAANLEESVGKGSGDTDVITELIERYATAAIFPRVRAVYETAGAGHWACRPQDALLAYLLRVDPAFGGEQLNKALAARGKDFTRCYASALGSVAKLHMSTEVEEAATAALEDEDPEVVSQAADVLGRFGSADAEKLLWRRLERWHEATQSRSEEMTNQNAGIPAFGASESSGQAMIEQALRVALLGGQAWFLDPEKLNHLRGLCLTDQCRRDVDSAARSSNDISIWLSPFDDETYLRITVGQYQPQSIELLKQKLLQFPKGTLFKFSASFNQNNEAKATKLFEEVKSYLEDHGMKLQRVTGQ